MNKINIEKEIQIIKIRNKRVEFDKAWETSLTRKIIIAILTYIVISIFLVYINVEKPLITALVPSIAFILSTLTLPLLKKIWINKQKRK